MTAGPVVAGIDCGTNSLRLLIVDRGTGSEITREMRVVRLGEGVDETGSFIPAAIERTRAALSDYVDAMAEAGVTRVRMAATSATRDASNRDDFFAMTARELGRVVPGAVAAVISGDDEARLSFGGALGGLGALGEPVLVVDLGGGSTEFVTGNTTSIAQAFSADIGCVRLTERFGFDDPPSPEQIAAARATVRGALDEALSVVDVTAVQTWVGVAGTFTTMAALALGLGEYDADAIHGSVHSLAAIDDVCATLLAATREERLAMGPMHPGRADVIGGGAIVVSEIIAALRERAPGVTELIVSEQDILDGLAASA